MAQANFSSETLPTVWKTIPILELLQTQWETMLEHPKFLPVYPGIIKGLERLKKWYRRTNDTDAYFVNLALHPAWKLEYVKATWDDDAYEKGVKALEKLVSFTVLRISEALHLGLH